MINPPPNTWRTPNHPNIAATATGHFIPDWTGSAGQCSTVATGAGPRGLEFDSSQRRVLNSPIEISIRRAELKDIRVIAEFNLRLALETEDLRLDPNTVQVGVTELLAHPGRGIYFVAELAGVVVGQLMITYEWSDWRNGNLWWLQSVYVTPEFRQRGVFRALFAYLERLARDDTSVCGIRLYMHSTNDRARKSYERLGLQRTHYEVFEKDLRQP